MEIDIASYGIYYYIGSESPCRPILDYTDFYNSFSFLINKNTSDRNAPMPKMMCFVRQIRNWPIFDLPIMVVQKWWLSKQHHRGIRILVKIELPIFRSGSD
jgi:hypothetical protein